MVALTAHMPDLAALELLLAVERTGSLGAASRELGITQQAASARMRTAEAVSGVPLLERRSRGSRLTPAGRLVAQWADRVLAAAEELGAGIETLRQEQQTKVRVAASLTVAEYLLPGWLTKLKRGPAGPAVQLFAVNSRLVMQMLLDGAADLGFVETPDVVAGLAARTVGRDELVCVVAPQHVWARRRRPVPLAELARTALITREAGSGTRRALERVLEEADVGPVAPPQLELPGTAAVRSAVLAGAAPAVLSRLAVEADLATSRLRQVRVTGLSHPRSLQVVWPEGARLRGAARDLLDIATAG
jgi:molybdate transport repressor ModE-like protein